MGRETLLPCPFCGANPHVIDLDRDGAYVRCRNLSCDATGPMRRTKAEATAAWNDRAPTPPETPGDPQEKGQP